MIVTTAQLNDVCLQILKNGQEIEDGLYVIYTEKDEVCYNYFTGAVFPTVLGAYSVRGIEEPNEARFREVCKSLVEFDGLDRNDEEEIEYAMLGSARLLQWIHLILVETGNKGFKNIEGIETDYSFEELVNKGY